MFGNIYDSEEDFLDDLEDTVIEWFDENCGEDGYDSQVERVRDLEAMVDESNDPAIDDCIYGIEDKFDEIELENYRDVISMRLSNCASSALSFA